MWFKDTTCLEKPVEGSPSSGDRCQVDWLQNPSDRICLETSGLRHNPSVGAAFTPILDQVRGRVRVELARNTAKRAIISPRLNLLIIRVRFDTEALAKIFSSHQRPSATKRTGYYRP